MLLRTIAITTIFILTGSIFAVSPVNLDVGLIFTAYAQDDDGTPPAEDSDPSDPDANGGANVPTGIVPTEDSQEIPNPLGFDTLEEATFSIINIAYSLAALVAIIYLIIGGYQYIISSGNPDAIEAAKATIMNAIIGLVVILISYLVVHYILGALGAGGLIPGTR